ncbi:unnamed protein product [Rotaria sordida]|uniref:C2H2-type domain-containing protein n=1 Tax=Rotaria sordida TaxID=392033 RepID=A0A813S8U3_9BILA|nr:unnamed protein product [Rotaria sordida]CAF1080416.1 unnamed protein product [Rotaria sordida]
MSRRKQLHPKSLKEGEEILFDLPNELEYDEGSNHIIARMNLKQDHCFGPFPAILQIEDGIECFQLLDIKHNWLVHCSILNNSSINLNLIFENNQLLITTKESISIGTNLCLNKIILPKLNMNKDTQIKNEPKEIEMKIESPTNKHYPLIFICNTCGVRFSNRNTLHAHRRHYCTKRETTKSHSTDSTIEVGIKSIKRKSTDIIDSSSTSTKRLSLLSNDTYCHECNILFSKTDNFIQHKLYYCKTKSSSCKLKNKSIPFNRPVQIEQFIYVPIPVISSQIDTSHHDSKPLDLSKPKKINDEYERSIISTNLPLDLSTEKTKKIIQQQFYRCEYCSICFRSLKTLHAHQDNYCIEYRKQNKKDHNNLSTDIIENNRSPSPPVFSSNTSKSPSNDSLNPINRSFLFMCRLCKYQGNTLRGIRMHFKFHLSNNESCTDDDIIVKSTINSLTVPIRTSQLLLKCTICSAMFDYEEILLNHIINVHTNKTLCECLECQSRFSSRWNLTRHMKLVHTNIKKGDDDDDEQNDQQIKSNERLLDEDDQSSNSMNLIQKILRKSIDTNLIHKNLSCPFCCIKFSRIDTLQQHMMNYCASRPSTNEVLKYIKKTKTSDTYCSSCQILFQHKTSYDAHKMYYCPDSSKAHIKISV